MTWKDRLQDASFRGVPFKVEEESAGTGRRVETHEYPNRDKPYTEDLGKVTFRPSITAYVVGDDCFDQRDRLIEALNKPGPGTLVHPTYGELKVCVDGEVRVSTSKSEGRIVRFDLKFVEAGELSYPTSGGSNLYVFRPVAHTVDFHIRVTPDTPEIRAAITAELRSFLLRDGYPQGELKVSRISEAISGANGEYSHQLLAPADNISIAKNELAVLGTISWT